MISNQLTVLLRSIMILAGTIGFGLGAGLSLWKDAPISAALFRGALLCVACAFLARSLTMSLFRAYAHQLRNHKQKVTGDHQGVENKK